MKSCGTIELPKIQAEKWRRYIFETKGKYYIVILKKGA
jgi:hypothetical protein